LLIALGGDFVFPGQAYAAPGPAPRALTGPPIAGMADPTQRARILHALANHELQAIELFAWAVLAFPAAPLAFRRGLVAILADEQRHFRLYEARLAAYAIPFTGAAFEPVANRRLYLHAPIADGPTKAPSRLPGIPLELYVILLFIVSELAAFAAIGLSARSGEVVLVLGPCLGRPERAGAPLRAGAVAGALGADFLTTLWT